MNTEELFAKFKPHDDALIKKGMDCLYEKLGEFDAEEFLDIYHIRRFRESKGVNYTEWRRDNLWTGMTVEEISQEADSLWKKTHPTTTPVLHYDLVPQTAVDVTENIYLYG